MSNLKRTFEQFTNNNTYFTLLQSGERDENYNLIPNDLTNGKIFEMFQSPCEVVTLENLTEFLRSKLYEPEFSPNDDEYDVKLCKINLLGHLTNQSNQSNQSTTVNKFELVESYDLNIQTLIDFNINDITLLFNILSVAALNDRDNDFKIWLNSESYCLNVSCLNIDSDNGDKMMLVIRYALATAVKHYSFRVLECLFSSTIIVEHFGKNIPYYASVLNNIDLLDWWFQYFKDNGLQHKYDYDCIDHACKRGNYKVLQWWITKAIAQGIELLYTHEAMDGATLYGHTSVLQCWLHNKEALEQLGYSLEYSEEGFNLENISENSPFESGDTKEKYGFFLFNAFHQFVDGCSREYIADSDFTVDYCGTVMVLCVEWWDKSGLPIKISINALADAITSGYFRLASSLLYSRIQMAQKLLLLPKDQLQTYLRSIVEEIKKSTLPSYRRYTFDYLIGLNIETEFIKQLISKCDLCEGEERIERNVKDYIVEPSGYDTDDERLDFDGYWKMFDN